MSNRSLTGRVPDTEAHVVDMPPQPERPGYIPPFSRTARQIAESNNAAVVQAVNDYNKGRLTLHRVAVNAAIAKAEGNARRELVENAMRNERIVDDAVQYYAAGRPALEMNMRDLQAAHHAGEVAQIIQRGYGV